MELFNEIVFIVTMFVLIVTMSIMASVALLRYLMDIRQVPRRAPHSTEINRVLSSQIEKKEENKPA
jgi:uncharacterized membrane protein